MKKDNKNNMDRAIGPIINISENSDLDHYVDADTVTCLQYEALEDCVEIYTTEGLQAVVVCETYKTNIGVLATKMGNCGLDMVSLPQQNSKKSDDIFVNTAAVYSFSATKASENDKMNVTFGVEGYGRLSAQGLTTVQAQRLVTATNRAMSDENDVVQTPVKPLRTPSTPKT